MARPAIIDAPRMAMSMMIRFVAGLLLGPGIFSAASFAFMEARRAVEVALSLRRIRAAPGRARPLLLAAEIDRDHVRTVISGGNAGLSGLFRITLARIVLGRL